MQPMYHTLAIAAKAHVQSALQSVWQIEVILLLLLLSLVTSALVLTAPSYTLDISLLALDIPQRSCRAL